MKGKKYLNLIKKINEFTQWLLALSGGFGKREWKGTASARSVRQGYGTVHLPGKSMGDAEPKSGVAFIMPGGISPVETFKDKRLLLVGDSETVIWDGERHMGFACLCRQENDRVWTAAAVWEGIVQEDRQDLVDPLFVSDCFGQNFFRQRQLKAYAAGET